jgi:hypothetical protein
MHGNMITLEKLKFRVRHVRQNKYCILHVVMFSSECVSVVSTVQSWSYDLY